MRERPSKYSQARYQHLLTQLRTAAGVVSAGVVGSTNTSCGSSGGCWEMSFALCVNLSEIGEWRDAENMLSAGVCPDLEELQRFALARAYPQPESLLYAADAGTMPADSGTVPTDAGSIASGSSVTECCYRYTDTFCIGGRPFLVDGYPRQGVMHGRSSASRNAQATAIAAAWRRDALLEHASVAAFARLTLELLHHGAPLDLVARAQAASLDEVRHAQICRRRGEEIAGDSWEFGALATGDSLTDLTLSGFLRRNVIEGCIGETVAACVMRERAQCAEDPELQRELEQIAEDETRHATLAFSIARWVSARYPSMRAELRDIFDDELTRIEAEPPAPPDDAILGTTQGQIPTRDILRIQREVCAHVLRPLARELGSADVTIATERNVEGKFCFE